MADAAKKASVDSQQQQSAPKPPSKEAKDASQDSAPKKESKPAHKGMPNKVSLVLSQSISLPSETFGMLRSGPVDVIAHGAIKGAAASSQTSA